MTPADVMGAALAGMLYECDGEVPDVLAAALRKASDHALEIAEAYEHGGPEYQRWVDVSGWGWRMADAIEGTDADS